MDSIEQNKYNDILRQIISEIKSARVVVARRVNSEMMHLYWSIGKRLSVEGLEKGYGSSVVKRLAADLQQEFPGTTGFSARNLWNMKRFYEFYALVDEKVQRSVALLPWKHNLLIMSKTTSVNEAKYYAEQCYENNWSRNILLNFIKADTYKNAKLLPKQHNFEKTLSEDIEEQTDENPSIGIVLCADKEHVEVEIALRDVNKPIGVADYQLQFPEKEIKELISNELKKQKYELTNPIGKKQV